MYPITFLPVGYWLILNVLYFDEFLMYSITFVLAVKLNMTITLMHDLINFIFYISPNHN